MGVDPGASGSIVVIGEDRWEVEEVRANATDHDIDSFLREWDSMTELAMLEKVASTPQMGVASAFSFGRSAGFLCGLMTAHRVPMEFVAPLKWQKEFGLIMPKDTSITVKKNKHKAAAQQLFPHMKVTHYNADALLLAEYCKRLWISRHPSASGTT